MIVDPTADVLDAAADLLRRDGWCQGAFTDGTARCAAQAISAVSGPDRHANDALRVFVGRMVTVWNDAPDQTRANVVATMRDCAHEHRGKVGR